MRKTYFKAFTLVELIVVITVLSILSTIAFLSLSGYGRYARNTARLSDIQGIHKLISVRRTEGEDIFSFVNTGQEISGAQLKGTGAIVGVNYIAGTINTRKMRVLEDDYRDLISGELYRVGVVRKIDGIYHQVAATIENEGTGKAEVVGNYLPRDNSVFIGSTSSGSSVFTLLERYAYTYFEVGDVITSNNLPSGVKITNIRTDGRVSLDNNFTSTSTGISLATSESLGLIGGEGGLPVVEGGINIPYSISN